MKTISFPIWDKNEYHFPMTFEFLPNITGYIHEENTNLPGIIILPGGGFCNVSPIEAKIVGLKFYQLGFQAFVLTYTVNPCEITPLGRQALNDTARAIRLIRSMSQSLSLIPNQIAICGFSAGGHLCASLAVHYKELSDVRPHLNTYSCRPDAVLLSYPVITLANQPYEKDFCKRIGITNPSDLDWWCPERHVSSSTPPCFLWHTRTDSLISSENSLLFAHACHQNNVPYCLHIFSSGDHGMSTADDLLLSWHLGKDFYTLAQLKTLLLHASSQDNLLSFDQKEKLENLITQCSSSHNPWIGKPNPEVAQWTVLAATWLSTGVIN